MMQPESVRRESKTAPTRSRRMADAVVLMTGVDGGVLAIFTKEMRLDRTRAGASHPPIGRTDALASASGASTALSM